MQLLTDNYMEECSVCGSKGSTMGAVCCVKSWLFSTTGSHGSQGPEACTLQPLLVYQGFFSLMLATGPKALNSAALMLF